MTCRSRKVDCTAIYDDFSFRIPIVYSCSFILTLITFTSRRNINLTVITAVNINVAGLIINAITISVNG